MRFLQALDPATIDAAIAAAEKRADETHKKNWPKFQTESASVKIEAGKQREKYKEAIEGQFAKTEVISGKLAEAREALDKALQEPNAEDKFLKLQISDLEKQLKAQDFQAQLLQARLRKVDTEEQAKINNLMGLLGEKGLPIVDPESTDPQQQQLTEASKDGGGSTGTTGGGDSGALTDDSDEF
jgi:hypothetical protein